MGELIKIQKGMTKKGKRDEWAEQFLAMLAEWDIRLGREPDTDEVRAKATAWNPDRPTPTLTMGEEIAAMRYVLRNVFRLAMLAQERGEYIRLVGIYSSGGARLGQLLRGNKDQGSQLTAFLQSKIEQAIREVNEEWEVKRKADHRQRLEGPPG